MKHTRTALLAFLLPVVMLGSFIFGRYVSVSATMPLNEAHVLASDQDTHGLWRVEAQNTVAGRDMTYPATFPQSIRVAQNDATSDTTRDSSADLFSSTGPLVTFQQVYELLKENFVNHIVDDAPLAHGAVSSMLASLDEPNSRFLSADDLSAINEQSKGVFSGAGIVFTVRKAVVDGLLERQLTVIDAVQGSPAQRDGIQTGDIIDDINGHWIISYDPFVAQVKLFKSLENDPVSFNNEVDAVDAKIKSGYDLTKAQAVLDETSTTPLVLAITRGSTNLSVTVDTSVPTQVTDVVAKTLPDGNGYLQINTFTDTTAADFEKAFSQISSAPGIVIDLRSCPGGSVDPALALAADLDPNAPLGSVSVRDSGGTLDATAGFKVRTEQLSGAVQSQNPISYQGHIVVLVNEGTANVAELFAAFLHDNLGARIVGNTTFGDGMVQTIFPIGDGSAYTLTTGLVKTSQDITFEAKGLTPDVSLAKSQTDSPAGLSSAESLLTLKPLTAAGVVPTDGQQKS